MSYITIEAKDEQGVYHEILMDRAGVPEIGATFEEDGVQYQRVPTIPRSAIITNYDFKGWSLPFEDAVRGTSLTPAPHYDEKGVACFTSRREMSEYAARVNDNPSEGVQLAWNPDGNE